VQKDFLARLPERERGFATPRKIGKDGAGDRLLNPQEPIESSRIVSEVVDHDREARVPPKRGAFRRDDLVGRRPPLSFSCFQNRRRLARRWRSRLHSKFRRDGHGRTPLPEQSDDQTEPERKEREEKG
jgi:hypothetical protein